MPTRYEKRRETELTATGYSEKRRSRAEAIRANGGITLAELADYYRKLTGVTASRRYICGYLNRRGLHGHVRRGYPAASAFAAVRDMPPPRPYLRAHTCLTRDQLRTGEYLPLCYISATQNIPLHRMESAARYYSIPAFLCMGILWGHIPAILRWWKENKERRHA